MDDGPGPTNRGMVLHEAVEEDGCHADMHVMVAWMVALWAANVPEEMGENQLHALAMPCRGLSTTICGGRLAVG